MGNISLTLGKIYEVTRANGEIIKFKFNGDECTLIPSGEKMSIQVVLGTYVNVNEVK